MRLLLLGTNNHVTLKSRLLSSSLQHFGALQLVILAVDQSLGQPMLKYNTDSSIGMTNTNDKK